MKLKLAATISFLLLLCIGYTSYAQQQPNPVKRITVKVVNVNTGNPVKDAEVSFKGLLLKKTKRTDSEGKVTYDVPLLGESQIIDIQVKNPASEKDYTTSVTLVKTRDSYEVSASLALKVTKKLTVTVTDQINNSVGGARVEIGHTAGYTQENGIVVFEEIAINGNYEVLPVSVVKPGFSSYKSTITFDQTIDQYNVSAQIINEKGYKKIRVHAIARDDGKPIAGALINAIGKNNSYSGQSDENGIANLSITSPDDFEVVIKHAVFWEESRLVSIKQVDDDKSYALEFSMRRKEPQAGGKLIVHVIDEDSKPINGVTVELPGDKGLLWTGVTGADGAVEFHHNLKQGDKHSIHVRKAGYKSKTKAFTVGSFLLKDVQDLEYIVLEKGIQGKVQFVAQVFDHATNKPIALADVGIQAINGNAESDVAQTNSKGEASLYLYEGEVENNSLRLMAMAQNYERKWSDIPPGLLQATSAGKRYLQIYLDKKKSPANPEEKYYGSYKVNLSSWVPTGVHVKKGSNFRVDAGGFLYNPNAGTGVSKEIHPDGYGYWNWYVLSVRIGKNLIPVGRQGTGNAPEEGDIELGAPRSQNIFPGDDKDVTGDWNVKLYATDAVQTKPNNSATGSEPPGKKLEEAKKDLEFLNSVLKGGRIDGWLDPSMIQREVRRIIYKYGLNPLDPAEEEQCMKAIEAHYKYLNTMITPPSDAEIKMYYTCVQQVYDELKSKMDKKEM
ncbi:MAG: hypothetical protein JWN76_2082 [Chitinophagaceae bacterium]|nr:hypothetical protein [Chitinophagaceae bacterium]